jgi:acetylornithine deacetylase/succinyl-diaminopimelate desuccinylase-like protein
MYIKSKLIYCFQILIFLSTIFANPNWDQVQIESVSLLQKYIQIDTSNPPGDVTKAINWLADLCEKNEISYQTFTVDKDPRRMHLLAEIKGENSNLKPLLLLNHVDVVPADLDAWSTDPFGAEIKDGIIYGRGALDMKSLGMMQLISLILLNREGWVPDRTVKFLAVADEEILGEYGVQWMIENHWDLLDPEWVWDEGGIGSTDSFPGMDVFAIAVAQKKSFWVEVEVNGLSGHGSRPFDGYPNQVLATALSKIVNWKTPIEINPVIEDMFYRIGDNKGGMEGFVMKNINNPIIHYLFSSKVSEKSTTVNAMLRNTISLTQINSGYKTNIIPEKANATLDIRLLPDTNPKDFLLDLERIVKDKRVNFTPKRTPSNNFISEWDNRFFNVVSKELYSKKPNAVVIPFMTIGGTDSQFFQEKGVDCYGIIPVLVDESDIQTMHGIDERISIENYMFGLQVVYNSIKKVCGKE